jgi:RNA polymerase sigma factor (sigma-70 family)
MPETAEDIDLLKAWIDGDNRAGSALVRRHFDALYRFFANKATGCEEDLIQQTFMASVEAKDAFRGESSFRAYLFGLARFQLLTHYRKVYRRPALDAITTSIRDIATSPSGTLVHREEAQLLERALEQIPIDQQIALELTYWEELSAPEIARVLDVPENTVYSRLSRAKRQLREVLATAATVETGTPPRGGSAEHEEPII